MKRFLQNILIVSSAVAVLNGQSVAEEDSLLAARAAVRDNMADLFSRKSSILGPLPSPAELAAGDTEDRQPPRPGPYTIDFDDKSMKQYELDYKFFTLTGAPRRRGRFPLGITGAYARDSGGHTEFGVLDTEAGSPADGVLNAGDIIIGVNGRIFKDPMDPRPDFGYALVESQSEKLGGILTLQIVRDGKAMNVQMDLGNKISYSPTWPYDCEKSRQIVADAVKLSLDSQTVSIWWGSLFLMASGDPAALELVRRGLYVGKPWDAKEPELPLLPATGANAWAVSYGLINLAEYYLLTGDANVLPQISASAHLLAAGQDPSGGWSHGCPPGGYGNVNNVGLSSFLGLVLAQECGITVDEQAMARSVRYFGKHCGGWIGYGVEGGSEPAGGCDNGMYSTMALSFSLLGEKELGQRAARATCYTQNGREYGHAERIFTMGWGAVGAALAPREEFCHFMNNTLWLYELARGRDGGFTPTMSGMGPPTVYALTYAIPLHKIRITGAPRGVFGTPPPFELEEAAQLYKDKRWKELKTVLDQFISDKSKKADDRKYAQDLLDAYNRMEEQVAFTLKLIEANIASGERARASQQLDALQRLLGEERPELIRLNAAAQAAVQTKVARPPAVQKKAGEPRCNAFAPPAKEFDYDVLMPLGTEASGTFDEGYYVLQVPSGKKVDLGDWLSASYNPRLWNEKQGWGRLEGWQKCRGAIPADKGKEVYVRRAFPTMASPDLYKYFSIETKYHCVVYINGYRIATLRSDDPTPLRTDLGGALSRDGRNIVGMHFDAPKGNSWMDLTIKAGPTVLSDLLDDGPGGIL